MAKSAKPDKKARVVPEVQVKERSKTPALSLNKLDDEDGPPQVTPLKPDEIDPSDLGITHWLGIPRSKKIASYLDYIKLSNTGITKASVNTLADYLGVNRKYISENIFDLSVKTMERKEDDEKLSRKISSHALEIAKLLQHAYHVFRNEDKLKQWLNRENRALNNMKPVELLDTLSGLILVDDVLGRIEEGVYA
jgi:putative toxin-antitoxin system antitoxin component (TIGR02293 family)